MTGLSDSFQRPINYLRISVTDRCNLRCVYCMPNEGVALASHSQILSYEEIKTVATAAAEVGITKIRLTGGEPLIRLGIVDLVKMLSQIKGIDDLSLTTNAILLDRYATELKEAGLKRVNISLDTLKKAKFEKITRIGTLEQALAGIRAAHKAKLEPVKINVVAMRGINDDEISDFAKITTEKSWHVRFIEIMPFKGNKAASQWFMPRTEIEAKVRDLGNMEPVFDNTGHGPAKYFRFPHAKGTIGFISSVTEHICMSCNRLRLTADGRLRPCLLSDNEIDLRVPLRSGASNDELKNLIQQAVANKPKGHQLHNGATPENRNMAQIGDSMTQSEDKKLTHIDESGRARMVDVTSKPDSVREAIAKGSVKMQPSTFELIKTGQVKKGEVLAVAQVAGISAAKQTPHLIPMCHPITIDSVAIDFDMQEPDTVEITATVKCTGKTGVEMEAVTAVSVSALTIYDMCKAVDRGMKIENIRLVKKSGGKSGTTILE